MKIIKYTEENYSTVLKLKYIFGAFYQTFFQSTVRKFNFLNFFWMAGYKALIL